MIEIYTDGSCLKNCTSGGPGGWAFIIKSSDLTNNIEYQVSGGNEKTTNNQMELQAVIEALSFLIPDCQDINKYKIYTDSQLTLKCAKKEWKRKANLDLWEIFDQVSCEKDIVWEWVKAHNGNYYNEKVDKLAIETAREFKCL